MVAIYRRLQYKKTLALESCGFSFSNYVRSRRGSHRFDTTHPPKGETAFCLLGRAEEAPRQEPVAVTRIMSTPLSTLSQRRQRKSSAEGQKRVRVCCSRNEMPIRANHSATQEKKGGRPRRGGELPDRASRATSRHCLRGCRKRTCPGVTKCNKEESLDGSRARRCLHPSLPVDVTRTALGRR